MNMNAKILLIEDDASTAASLKKVLCAEDYEVDTASRGDTGLELARQNEYNVVISDLRLPGLGGLDLVAQLHAAKPKQPIILMTGHGTTETAIEATKRGACDYLLKPFEADELLDLVASAVASSRLMSEAVEMGEARTDQSAIIGKSRAMQAIYKEIGRVAATPTTVLIRCATGTGKELIARAIYQHSLRADKPFIAVNCAAIPDALLESELFGHERGAFTGADAKRIGRFEQADHGTIFLDEIGDLPPGTQSKLLRVLQEKTLRRLGGKETISVDVRVVVATHRDLETAIREKQFREDLYYRLNVVAITLPPLRHRREDIPDLVRFFLGKHGPDLGNASPSIHSEAVELLQSQSWPGNVRELENVMRKALLAAQGYTIILDHVRTALNKNSGEPYSAMRSFGEYVDELLAAARREEITDTYARVLETAERELFARAIQQARGNQAKAARWLGISRITMKAKLVQFGLHPGQDTGQEP